MKNFIFLSLFLCAKLAACQIDTTLQLNPNDTIEPPSDTIKIIQSDNKTSFEWGGKRISFEKDSVKLWPEILLSLGFNFDFLDGIKANDLYADINVDLPFIFNPKVGKTKSDGFIKNLGIEFGLYQMRTLSSIDTSSEQFQIIDAVRQDSNAFTFNYITIPTKGIRETSRENIGLFFQPKYSLKLLNLGQQNYANLSILGHIEWTRSIVNIKLSREFSPDTTDAIPDSWGSPPYELTRTLPPLLENTKFVEYNSNYGVGWELFVSKKSGSIHLKQVLGLNNYRVLRGLGNTTQEFLSYKNLFYLVQAEVMENNILGIKLGAEVRGYWRKNPQVSIERNTPFFTVYLAKQFSFDKIAELFKPN